MKRLLSGIMAMLLVMTTVISTPSYAIAEDLTGEAVEMTSMEFTEEAEDASTQESTEEIQIPTELSTTAAEVIMPAAETAAETTAAETTAQTEAETVVQETTAAENAAEETTEAVQPETTAEAAETTAAYPEFSYSEAINGVVLTITAPEGVLPEGTTVTARPMTLEEVKALMADQIAEEGKEIVDAVMFDVTLFDADGNVIQPDGKVQITLDNLQLSDEAEEVNVYRVQEESGDIDVLKENVDPQAEEVVFENDHFTPVGAVALLSNEPGTHYGFSEMDDAFGNRFNTGDLRLEKLYVIPVADVVTKINPVWGYEEIDDVKTTEKAAIAYCFNENLRFPHIVTKKNYYNEIANAGASKFAEAASRERITDPVAFRKKILTVALNGYPHDYSELNNGVLTADEFRVVTQLAIWYYTDSLDQVIGIAGDYTGKMLEVYNKLISAPDLPDSILDQLGFVNIYTPYSDGGIQNDQNLLNVGVINQPLPPRNVEQHSSAVEVVVDAEKELVGGTLTEGQFQFVLKDAAGSIVSRGTNDADGKIVFDPISYTQAGTYTYTMEEVNDGQTGIIYDTSSFTVQVTIAADDMAFTQERTYYATSDTFDTQLFLMRNGMNGQDFRVYCINHAKDRPLSNISGEYTYNLLKSPSAEEISQYVLADRYGAAAVSELRKVFYFTETVGNGLSESEKNQLVWYATGYDRAASSKVATAGQYAGMTYKELTEMIIRETEVPNGYNLEIYFPDDESKQALMRGTMMNSTAVVQGVPKFTNSEESEAEVWFSKRNINSEEIAGAVITVSSLDNNGFSETWTSVEGETKKLNLKPGSYLFHEETAPDGYVTVNDIEFTVDEKGTVEIVSGVDADADGNLLAVTDRYEDHKVIFSKVNIGGEEIEGAYIQIFDVNGDVVDEWESETVTHYTDLNMGTYTFHEVNAPDGYETVTDITFIVDAKGNVEVVSDESGSARVEDGALIVTDSYTPVEFAVSKVWNDNNNQDGKRANSVSVTLAADGVLTDKTAVLNEGNNWSFVFTDLEPVNDEGRKIEYTVVESPVNAYEASVEYSNGAAVITNTHTTEVVKVEGIKTWNDNNNQDGKRPESIVVILKKAGQEIERKTVTEADGWKYSFENLDKYENNGAVIRYSIEEEVPEGYQSSITDYNITNTYTPGLIAIQVSKSWMDNNNQDGIRPNEVTVHLYADGADTGKTVTLNEGNNWTANFDNLDEYVQGRKIVYSVKEDEVNGYVSSVEETEPGRHFTITNTHTPEVISVEGTKTWNDNNDQDGVRPESIEVILKKAGQEIERKTVTEADGWKYSFDNLPKYEKNGAEIRYSIQEEVPAGYQSVVNGYDLTNNYTPGSIEVQVAKSWIDNDNQDGIRPNDITVHLYANGTDTGKTVTLNVGNNWTAGFENLDEYADGEKIVYTVKEDAVEGYISTVESRQDGKHFTITNTHTPEVISVEGTKTWNDNNDQDGVRPESITVILKKAGQEIERKTVTEADGWKYSFDNLPKYENNGAEIRYSIQEEVPTGYQSVVNGYDLTNNYTPGSIEVQVAKSWIDNDNQDGIRPNDITVHLYADGADTGKTVILNAGNNWTAGFENLDEYADGEKIVYTVKEDAVEGYTSTVESRQDGKHFTFTNTHTPEVISVEGTKTWNDNNDQDGVRPDSIVVILKRAGQEIARKTVTEADGWKYSFDNLPKYENNGARIRYSIQEEVPTGYQSVVSGYDITNNYTPGKIEVQVNKSWIDNDNQDGLRPNNVTVRLYADGADTGKAVTLDVGNNWTAGFENLDEYADGEKIVYTVKEDAVEGYTSTVESRQDGRHFIITNTHTPDVTFVEGTKTWNDNNDQDGVRPDSIVVILKRAGQEIARKTVTEADGWKYSFDNLPKYENNGAEIRYSIQEEVPAGYQSVVNGYDLTNNYTPGKIEVQVAKSWIDNDNQDGIRPNDITVHLYADGADTGKTVILNAGNNWTAGFENLDEYAGGEKIVYTVKEDAVEGYTSTVESRQDGKHFTITNTHTPEVIRVEGTKTWNDNNDQDGVRPDSIVVILKRAGQEIARKTVTEADGWKYSFDNLPKYENNGAEIRYSIQEEVPTGYQSVVNGYDLTNNYTPGKIAVQVSKSWIDNNNQDGIRPDEIIVHLYANGADTGKTVILNAANNWIDDFNDLDEYAEGEKIVYTVKEDAVEGYTSTIESRQDGKHFIITNTHNVEYVSIQGTKTWNDRGNKEEKRPAYIIVTLNADGIPYAAMKVKASDDWKYSFDNMPKYSKGTEIVYTVEENPVDGYETVINGTDIINNELTRKVVFSKTDIAGEELIGADITLKKEDGTELENWTSDGTAKEFQLEPGRYVFEETAAPAGYEIATTINFTVNEDGTVTADDIEVTGEDQNVVVMVDAYSDQTVEISKTDIGGNEIEGAKLTITDENGNVVDEWTSVENETHKSALQPGTYTLTEITAPKGYEVAESITFSVDKDGVVKAEGEETDKVVMVDAYSDQIVEISKTDIGGNEIEGAKLTITDENGNVVDEWTSVENETHKSELQPGTYTLTEVTAPKGYEVAESITFSVDKDGVVKAEGEETDKVVMVDAYSDQIVEISKTDIGGNEIEGAKLTITDENGNVVDEWTSVENETHKSALQPGTYTLTEVTAPKGYEVAESITFSVDKDGVVKAEGEETDKVVMVDAYSDQIVEISKTDIGGKEIEGAKLTITDENGNVVDEWTSVENESHKSALQPGTYTLTEVTAPKGYEVAESITFSVDKDGVVKAEGEETDKVVMVDAYSDQIVEISKTDIGGKEIEGAKLTITDENGNVVDEWTSVENESHKSELQPGTYTLTEVTAPKGYEVAESITFSVDKDGVVKAEGEETDKVVMVDAYSDQIVEISKTDIGGKEIEGAKLTITDENGNVVDEWTSVENETHKSALQPGTYTLTEVTAPKGYEIAESITFSVDKDGKVTVNGKEVDKVVMVDKYSEEETPAPTPSEPTPESETKILGIEDLSSMLGFMFIGFGAIMMLLTAFCILRMKSRR